MSHYIAKLTASLVLLLAVVAFVLSYNALQAVALDSGLPLVLSYLWPALIDFALVVFSLSVVRASLLGERTLWPWLLVSVSTIATIGFNLIHVTPGLDNQWINWLVAIMPPLALFLSFESLMNMIKSGVKRQETITSLANLTKQRDNLVSEIGQLELAIETSRELYQETEQMVRDNQAKARGIIDQANAEAKQITNEANRQAVPAIEADNLTPEQRQGVVYMLSNAGYKIKEQAAILGVSEGTIKNDRASFNGHLARG